MTTAATVDAATIARARPRAQGWLSRFASSSILARGVCSSREVTISSEAATVRVGVPGLSTPLHRPDNVGASG
jgi:hypothetical protein